MRLRGITESGFQRISQTLDLEDSEGEVLDGAEDELEEKPEDLTGGLEHEKKHSNFDRRQLIEI